MGVCSVTSWLIDSLDKRYYPYSFDEQNISLATWLLFNLNLDSNCHCIFQLCLLSYLYKSIRHFSHNAGSHSFSFSDFSYMMIPIGIAATLVSDINWNYKSTSLQIFDNASYQLQYLNHATNFFLYIQPNMSQMLRACPITCTHSTPIFLLNWPMSIIPPHYILLERPKYCIR